MWVFISDCQRRMKNEGPSEGVNNQRSMLEEFVKQHRLSVFDTYVDDGWSGTNFDRPDFSG